MIVKNYKVLLPTTGFWPNSFSLHKISSTLLSRIIHLENAQLFLKLIHFLQPLKLWKMIKMQNSVKIFKNTMRCSIWQYVMDRSISIKVNIVSLCVIWLALTNNIPVNKTRKMQQERFIFHKLSDSIRLFAKNVVKISKKNFQFVWIWIICNGAADH